MKRKGLGKGLGKGYKNIIPQDPHIHSLSARGVKKKRTVIPIPTLKAQGDFEFQDVDEMLPELEGVEVPEEYEYEMPEPPKPKKKGAGFPFPSTDPKKHYGKDIVRKGKEIIKKGVDVGRQQIEKRQLKQDFIKHMSDQELREKAILVGKPAIGKYNAFEREIVKREKNKLRLQGIIDEAQEEAITGEKSGAVNLGFLNPIGTLTNKREEKTEQPKPEGVVGKPDYFGFLNPVKTLSSKGRSKGWDSLGDYEAEIGREDDE